MIEGESGCVESSAEHCGLDEGEQQEERSRAQRTEMLGENRK